MAQIKKEVEKIIQRQTLLFCGAEAMHHVNGRIVRGNRFADPARQIVALRTNSGVLHDARGIPVSYGSPGFPDACACICGRFVGIEFKGTGQRQTPNQVAWQTAIEDAGGVYILADSFSYVRQMITGLVEIWKAR